MASPPPHLAPYVLPFPRAIRIEPAGACNLRCSHCPTGTVDMARGMMHPETFDRIVATLDRHRESVKVVVLYHGGEPLLNKRFPQMVRAIKALGIPFVKTVSNGMLLTDAAIEAMLVEGLDHIEFSIDGRSPAENDLIRRECEYATVVANIKRLIVARRARGSSTPKIFLSNTQFIDPARGRPTADPDAPPFLVEEFSGEWAGEIEGFKCTWAMRWPHMNVLDDLYELYRDPNDTEFRNECDLVEHTVTVRWNGDVVTCCYDLTNEYVIGNVKEADLADIWNNQKYLGLRRSIATGKLFSPCTTCNKVVPAVYLVLKRDVVHRLRVI